MKGGLGRVGDEWGTTALDTGNWRLLTETVVRTSEDKEEEDEED